MESKESRSADAVTITAAQVVFTNVEVEQSPLGHRGFQTVFYTEDNITKEVLQSEIEPALQYFPRNGYGAEDSPPEFVFFPLSTKQIAIGRITPLLDKFDKFGRKKMLFAHVLVFEANDFLDLLNNNPFVVLDADPFLQSNEDVLAQERVVPCRFNIPHRSLVLTRCEPAFDPSKLPPHILDDDHLLKLVFFASASATPKRKSFALELHGQPDPILELMRSLFAVIPPEFRSTCSFDTSFVGDTGQAKSSRSKFWANGVGKGQRLQQDAIIRIDLDKNESELAKMNVEVVTPFERWLAERPPTSAAAFASETMQRRIRRAALLQDILWGRQSPAGKAGIDEREVFDEFFECNKAYIGHLLKKNFQRQPGEALADRLVQCAMNWIDETGAPALAAVPRRFSTVQLCEWLLPSFEKRTDAKPTATEIEALQRCLIPDMHGRMLSMAERLLQAICLYWTANWQQLQNFLSASDREEFQRIAKWAISSASLRGEIDAHIIAKVGLFFGCIGTGFSEDGKTLLRILTFEPLQPGHKVALPVIGTGYCRRVVLEELRKPKETNSQKKPKETVGEGSRPLTALVSQVNCPFIDAAVPPWAIFQITSPGNVVLTGHSQFPYPRVSPELIQLLPVLCANGDHHWAFFRITDVFVIAELRKHDSIWTVLTTILDAPQFRAFQYNPFACITRAFGNFVKTPSIKNFGFGITTEIEASIGMQLRVSRGEHFQIHGSPQRIVEILWQLFEILPDRLRSQCTFFSGQLSADSPYRDKFLIDAGASTSTEPAPMFDAANRIWTRPDLPEASTPFEKCITSAHKHPSWRSLAPDSRMVFHQFFELSELLRNPDGVPVDERFSTPLIRIFLDINKDEMRQSLLHQLRRDLGQALGAALLNRAYFWIGDGLPDSIQTLRTGFSRPWCVEQTVSWLLDEHLEPIANDYLIDINNLRLKCAGDRSASSWTLRTLYAVFARKVDLLVGQMAAMENEFGDEANALVLAMSQRLLANIQPIGLKFLIEDSTSKLTMLGLQMELEPFEQTVDSNPANVIIPALFGCQVESELYEGGPSLKKSPDVTGRFWPLLIECLLEFSASAKNEKNNGV